jgi:predicted acylesterase/phospholipase RssA
MSAPHVPHGAPPAGYTGPRRCLILPGGGMRTVYQVGAIRALLEAGLCFTHADGTSGGSLNLSMLLSGLSPEEMWERWRTLNICDSISFLPLDDYLNAPQMPALGSHQGIVDKVIPHLGIDLDKVRAAQGIAAFYNVLNFSTKTVEVIPHGRIDLDMQLAGMSLPVCLPAVEKDGTWYTDTAFARDANLIEAVRNGAEELWVLWVIGNTREYLNGAFNQYVHMLEMAANHSLFVDLERIAEWNERIGNGETIHGHTRPITVHVIRPEIALPLDSDLYTGRVDPGTLLDRGYADAKSYLATMSASPGGVPQGPGVTQNVEPGVGISFRETMTGPFAMGETDPKEGAGRGEAAGTVLALHASIDILDLDRMLAEPGHAGTLHGSIDYPPLGSNLPGTRGVFNLFRPDGQPGLKLMVYELAFESGGQPYYLAGRKEVRDDRGVDLWKDTTTLYARLHQGPDASGPVVGAGTLHLRIGDLLKMIPTLHATNAPTAKEQARTVAKFGRFFLGELWDTYVKKSGE